MTEIICTIIGTGIVIGGAIGAILSGFYKTNKEAIKDHDEILTKFRSELASAEKRLHDEIIEHTHSFKDDLVKISEKLDDMKTHYVSNENFKTYADAMNQLLKMSTDRMARIETTLDDIRDDINSVIRNSKGIE